MKAAQAKLKCEGYLARKGKYKKGKGKCSRHDRGHGHAPFNGRTGRRLRKPLILDGTWAKLVRRMMGA